jgi:hypothetical protein
MGELILTEPEVLWHTEKGLSTDSEGRRILVGLTVEESIWHVDYVRRRAVRAPDWHDYRKANHAKFLELDLKHRFARIDVVYAENERVDDPTVV